MKVSDKFMIHNAKSKAFADHEEGDIPFVSNGYENRGVVGFVKPLNNELVFNDKAIVVSSFCEVSVQNPPFLPRGNGGSGLIVLIPKEEMSGEQLYSYAIQIESQSWRFSFGRMVTGKRLKNLSIETKEFDFSIDKYFKNNMPAFPKKVEINKPVKFHWVKLSDLGEMTRKYAPYLNEIDLSKKVTPYVTTTEENNGISGYCSLKPNFDKGQITISLDGTCGITFYQFSDFVSGEKTAVLKLKDSTRNQCLLFYIASLIRMLSWRYHYGRKLSMERLKEFIIPLPLDIKGNTDIDYIEKTVKSCYGYEELKQYF